MAKGSKDDQSLPTRQLAEEVASILGCSGAHQLGEQSWAPCASPTHLLKLMKLGKPGFDEWVKRQDKKALLVQLLQEKGVSQGFITRSQAESAALKLGCSGAHVVSGGMWKPCMTEERLLALTTRSGRSGKPNRRVVVDPKLWDRLRERGTRGIDTLPGGGLVSVKALMSDSFKPSAGMVEEAERGLAWRREFGRGGTAVGIARARDIANGRNLPFDTVKRMKAFFDRHQVDSEAEGFRQGEPGYPSNGRIAWALWGGDAGYAWSRKVVRSVDKG